NHPFEYAQLLGIFHVDVVIGDAASTPKTLDVLWVPRFQLDTTHWGGFKQKRLHRVEFIPDSNPNAYGFLNPDEVIRESHLIPAFAYGRSSAAHDLTEWEDEDEDDDTDIDWRYHYMNIFPDRDMYMRYAGGGPGHYA
ncbi:hypothetical protein BT96DRAFT_799669, partial [Gymnopus androsaceus JB14]